MISTKSMAMKVHKGAANIDVLRLEIKELNRDINSCYREMDTLRNQNMMLLEVLTDLTGDESYWSDQAKA